MICTWKGCTEEATHPQCDKTNKVWANLCKKHHAMLQQTLDGLGKAPQMVSYWLKAQGGAEVAHRRIFT